MKKLSSMGFGFILAASFVATSLTATTLAASSDYNFPLESRYTNTQSGQVYGEKLNIQDMTVMKIPVGTSLQDLISKLGKPKEYNLKAGRSGISMTYNGVTFFGNPIDRIVIVDRSEATARGISVGDKLENLGSAYGQPDKMTDTYWFYGQFKEDTNEKYGIQFFHDGKRVTRILITTGN